MRILSKFAYQVGSELQFYVKACHLKHVVGLSRFSSTMSREDLKKNAETAEHLIKELKAELRVLQEACNNRRKSQEEEEISRLIKQNDNLRKEVAELKFNLEFMEIQNGAMAVPLPGAQSKSVNGNSKAKEPKKGNNAAVVNQVKKENAAKKEKVEDGKKKENTKKTTSANPGESDKPVDASRLCLKIGKIVNVKYHPDADTLYVEEVDVGEEKNRTILSGLVKSVPIEEMKNKIAVFMCNLKPAKMRGILSEGMIMCASTPEKTEVLVPPQESTPGDRVYFEGFQGEPDKQLNPKRKIWEQVQPDLLVNSEGIATYKGGAMTVEGKGICKAPTMKECPIK